MDTWMALAESCFDALLRVQTMTQSLFLIAF